MTDEGWSTPSLYAGRGRIVEPRTFTEADPISAMFVADWTSEAADRPWSDTTYVGPRRKRPSGRHQHEAPAPPEPTAARAPDTVLAPVIDTPPPGAPVGVAGPDAGATVTGTEAPAEKSLLANSRTMAIASLVSRITGFLRSSLLVAAIGTGLVGDSYNVGNNLPNMVYELLLGGVLSSVFVPLLVHAQEEDPDGGVAYTQRLLSIATAALAVATLLAVACAPLFAAGFSDSAHGQRSLTSLFATLLLPEIFFYGIGAMLMAVLNTRHSFGPGAWSPVLNNMIMIVTLGVFWALPGPDRLSPTSITTPQVLVLGIGTTLGIAGQALVLLPSLRRTGFRWQWRFRSRPSEVGRLKEVGTLAVWLLGYVAASQVGVTVIAAVGVRRQAFTTFTFADLLIQMPYGILVVSLLTALMPRLSRAAAQGRTTDVVDDLGLGARLSALTLVPVTAGLIALGPVLCIVLFAYGEASISDARLIGTALAASAFGLLPFALVMLQLRVFYAMRDGRTPTLINVCMVATKVVVVLVWANQVHTAAQVAVALTVGTSASYVVGAAIGHVALTRRLGALHFGPVVGTVTKVGAASLLGGVAAYAVVVACRDSIGTGRIGAVSGLVLGGLAGLVVLVVILWRMRIPEIQDISAMVRRR